MLFFVRVENVTNGQTDKRTNTHRRVGRNHDEWTNGRTDEHTGGKKGTHTLTN